MEKISRIQQPVTARSWAQTAIQSQKFFSAVRDLHRHRHGKKAVARPRHPAAPPLLGSGESCGFVG
jgi:predicted component of type VI protein secretion system